MEGRNVSRTMTRASRLIERRNPQDLTSERHERRWRVLVALAIGLGVAVRFWAAAQWPANFQSDEAVFGLMARHILAGQFTPTLYGPAYLGSIESIISAGFMSVLGPSVMAFRMSAILLFTAFFVAHGLFTTRYFGYRVAFVSLLFLALPGFHVLEWTYQPIGAYGAMFVIGTLTLLAALPKLTGRWSRIARAAILGILVGLGLWANTTMILYVLAIGAVEILGSTEWRVIYTRLSDLVNRVVGIPLDQLLPLAAIGVAVLGVLAFFSSACSPQGLYITISLISRSILIGLAILAAGSFLAFSGRRRQLGIEAGVAAISFAVGYSPLLYPWIVEGVPPYWAVYPSCPEGVASRAKLLVKEILPGLWGLPIFDQLRQMAAPQISIWIVIGLLTLAALSLFIWRNRITLWRMMVVSPMDEPARATSLIALLLGLPIGISLLAGNTIDLYSIRHALLVVQASAIVFAIFLVWLATRGRAVGLVVATIWLSVMGVTNLVYANANWLVKFTRYDPEDISQLTEFLDQNKIEFGYADYWGAYTLDYLLHEKTILAPFNGIDRYLPYSDAVDSASKVAFVFPAGNAPAPTGTVSGLLAFLSNADNPIGEGAAFPRILGRLKGRPSATRTRVAAWDVWIVANVLPTPTARLVTGGQAGPSPTP
jgi:hypothetical protein